MKPEDVIDQTRCWVERAVVGLNLCPFARKPMQAGRIRYVVSNAEDELALLADLQTELDYLRSVDMDETETTILIHPQVLNDFYDYNNFLDQVDALLEQEGYIEEFQIASLHPHYQFAGTLPEDAENYTNRSPYPLLHILREESVDRALENYPDPDRIPERNIRIMEKHGAEFMQELLQQCLKEKN